ncbi:MULTISPECIES: sugar transferase [Sellimonas]|uniref:Sugar transferase n=1 Tax=Sellimonas caecigallum TaxID=2592333 RepID=A0ABS7L494_9FIRM|nr:MULTISPECIES: sugar transferase [Sellimonas]MBY0757845.1 sugar transferase [Sellimonas caecigallum]OUP64253.1 polyprenyl glycosylphosphotransferase [Drancourtella sp. An177]
MKRELKKFESTMWLMIKLVLYILLMGTFMLIMARENPTLIILSRTMGITFSTFCIVGLLFLSIYGKFDVGRRKSKPIIYSLALAVLFTDIVTYIQLMIMNTITPSIYAFRLDSIGSLAISFVVQLIIIIIFAYGGNALFFAIHKPESCCIVTSSQESLDNIVRGILKYKKQYKIDYIMDYRDKNLLDTVSKADTVFIHDVPLKYRGEIVRYCYKNKINIYFNPEIEDIVEMSAKYYLLDDVSVLNANVKAWTMEQRVMKKLLDMSLAIILGILTSPIWIVSAIAIKAYDGGHIFFKQKRATLNGRVFEVYKFRTMKENVENRSVTDDDDRITKPGKILRKIRMDELPQLINILKGDMSFVGPRPEMLENVEAYEKELPEFRYRLRVKAGLTGYAQIAGKYNTSPKDKLIMDMMYIEQFNILRDIQLIFQTAIVLLKSDSTEAFKTNETRKYIFKKAESEE